MEQTLATWLLPIVGLIAGIAIGYLVARSSAPNRTQRQVDDLQERFDTYQSEVVTHFNTTASLLRKLTNNYQDIQDHLSDGANRLALDEQTRQRLLASLHSEESNGARERLSSPTFTEPPKDYAPKNDDTPGTLHENFGLKSRH
ncbi:YhcB family protein [Pseudomonas sp.]|uniref:YhcB family protein n=1 Tax=Pseudomonas sp. TaxID=306 RepID=UPI003D0A3FE2